MIPSKYIKSESMIILVIWFSIDLIIKFSNRKIFSMTLYFIWSKTAIIENSNEIVLGYQKIKKAIDKLVAIKSLCGKKKASISFVIIHLRIPFDIAYEIYICK